jgi:hypothetical protein
MSKSDRDKRLNRGDGLLAEWGIATDAGSEALHAVLGRDADADLAIAARLGGVTGAESAALLRTLEDGADDKLVRREAKRSLYRLEQRGVSVERPAQEPRKLTEGVAPVEGFLSTIDGRGDQLIWLTRPRAGVLLHLFAVVNDPEGLKDLNLAEVSRKGLRAIREELVEKHEISLIEADWRYCDALIDRAFAWASARGEVGGDYPRLRAQLIKEPVAPLEPLIYRHLDREAVSADPKLLEESATLLDEKELRTWFLDHDTAHKYLDQLAEVRDSPIVLSEAQQGERLSEIVAHAVEEIYGGDLRPSWQRRLEEMAYFFHATGRPEQARKALAAGLAVGSREHGGRGVPLFEQICRTSILAYWQLEERKQEEQSQSSLVITPQQAAREAETRRRQRS